MERARSMRLHVGLPLNTQVEAINTTIYPSTPFGCGILEENRVAKHMNRTIMERVRSMRLHDGLPLHMWVEAINTTVYLINRGPSTPLGCGILEEAWTGKVCYSFLKTFGCEAFYHRF